MSERPEPPGCEIQMPLCGVCGVEVEHEFGGLACNSCHILYDGDAPHYPGEWQNPHVEPCGSRYLNSWTKKIHTCVLDAGHPTDGAWHECSCSHAGWIDAQALPSEFRTPSPDPESGETK